MLIQSDRETSPLEHSRNPETNPAERISANEPRRHYLVVDAYAGLAAVAERCHDVVLFRPGGSQCRRIVDSRAAPSSSSFEPSSGR